METNVATECFLLVELQTLVNLGMSFYWLIVIIHNVWSQWLKGCKRTSMIF